MMSATSDNEKPTLPPDKNRNTAKRLYILSEPEFQRDLLYSLIGWIVLLSTGMAIPQVRLTVQDWYYWFVTDWIMATAHANMWWSIVGLLSSSCCALQILLNAAAMGCAGWNTVLGPVRPLLLGMTLLLQVGSWHTAWSRPWQWTPTALSTFWTALLSFMPELLYLWNYTKATRNKTKKYQTPLDFSTKTTTTTTPTTTTATLHLQMSSVGCASCLLTVSSVLDRIPSVLRYEYQGTSIVTIDYAVPIPSRTNFDSDEPQKIQDRLADAGFPMSVFAAQHQ